MQYQEQKLVKNKGKSKIQQSKPNKGENDIGKSQRKDTNKKQSPTTKKNVNKTTKSPDQAKIRES